MFVSVKFNPAHSRTYTYRYDGPEQIIPGAQVLVETRDRQKRVEVAEIDLPEPDFACKSIIGLAPAAKMSADDLHEIGADAADEARYS